MSELSGTKTICSSVCPTGEKKKISGRCLDREKEPAMYAAFAATSKPLPGKKRSFHCPFRDRGGEEDDAMMWKGQSSPNR